MIIKQAYYKGIDKEINLWFKNLFDGMEIKEDKKIYPNKIFFFKNNKLYGYYYDVDNSFYYSHEKIYKELEFKIGFRYIGLFNEKGRERTKKIDCMVEIFVKRYFNIKFKECESFMDNKPSFVEKHFNEK